MPKHTIHLEKKEIKVVNVVKALNDLTSIDKAISFIINDFADSNSYAKFIKEHEKKLK
jgi:hypothetical protein